MSKSKKEILIATENKGKIEELKRIFENTNYLPRFLAEFEEELGETKILENAKTFEGNALIKAIIVGDNLGMLTLADDSGLCVDALDGAPGVYSARYSKEGTDVANYEKLLVKMQGVSELDRGCYYNCTVAIYDPVTNFVETVSVQWQGRIAQKPRGEKSFGYAPVFLSKDSGYEKTNAESDPEELTRINHRGKAFLGAIEILDRYVK